MLIAVKKIHYIIYGILMLFLFSACEWKFRQGEEEETMPKTVQRYDRLESRYLTTGDFSALQQMNTNYPIETRTLIEKMLQLGNVTDPNISNRFLMFYQDSTLQSLVADAEAEFANMDDINKQLQCAFDRLKEWIPELTLPMVYAQIGALDQSIVVGDQSIGISLDKYMGVDYPLYKKYYSYQQRFTMTRNFIIPDCLTFYLLSVFPMDNFDSRPQLDRDLHMGKIMWVVNKLLDSQVYKTEYVNTISKYTHHNPKVTVGELLKDEDYTEIEALHQE